MKKFKRMLAGLACVLAVCLCTPTAFAAKVIVYFDANGGTCTSAAERTNDEGKLGSLPGASMEGYTFDGWYTTGTDDVTGFPIDVQVKANDTAFGADTTVYAHWSANGGSAEVVEEKEVDPDTLLATMGLAAGSVVLVLLAKIFHLDMFTCGVASLANIGGSASAPILAGAYSGALVPVGVLMALMGYVIGTAGGLITANIMSLLA